MDICLSKNERTDSGIVGWKPLKGLPIPVEYDIGQFDLLEARDKREQGSHSDKSDYCNYF